MNARTSNALLVSGLVLATASWLIEKTVNDQTAKALDRLDHVGERIFQESTRQQLAGLLFAAHEARAERRIAELDRILRTPIPDGERRQLRAQRAFEAERVMNEESVSLQTAQRSAQSLFQIFGELEPAATSDLSALNGRLFDAMVRLSDLDRRARLDDQAAQRELTIASFNASKLSAEHEQALRAWGGRVVEGKERLERSAGRARCAFIATYVLSALLFTIGQLARP